MEVARIYRAIDESQQALVNGDIPGAVQRLEMDEDVGNIRSGEYRRLSFDRCLLRVSAELALVQASELRALRVAVDEPTQTQFLIAEQYLLRANSIVSQWEGYGDAWLASYIRDDYYPYTDFRGDMLASRARHLMLRARWENTERTLAENRRQIELGSSFLPDKTQAYYDFVRAGEDYKSKLSVRETFNIFFAAGHAFHAALARGNTTRAARVAGYLEGIGNAFSNKILSFRGGVLGDYVLDIDPQVLPVLKIEQLAQEIEPSGLEALRRITPEGYDYSAQR